MIIMDIMGTLYAHYSEDKALIDRLVQGRDL